MISRGLAYRVSLRTGLIALVVLGQMADLLSYLLMYARRGQEAFPERNGIVQAIDDRFGLAAVVAVRLGLIAFVVIVVHLLMEDRRRRPRVALLVALLAFGVGLVGAGSNLAATLPGWIDAGPSSTPVEWWNLSASGDQRTFARVGLPLCERRSG